MTRKGNPGMPSLRARAMPSFYKLVGPYLGILSFLAADPKSKGRDALYTESEVARAIGLPSNTARRKAEELSEWGFIHRTTSSVGDRRLYKIRLEHSDPRIKDSVPILVELYRRFKSFTI